MWKQIKVILKAVRDFFISMVENAESNIVEAIDNLGWYVIPIIGIAAYILYMLPQLAVFAVIASFTSGIQDPILKFIAGIIVFSAMEFLLVTVAWTVVVILGLPEMFRFSCYIKNSYERRLMEEEIREAEGKDITLSDAYKRVTNHGLQS